MPPRRDGQPAPQLAASTRRLMIVGANGAGKSRFAARLIADNSGAFSVSALRALYSAGEDGDSPVDKAFERIVSHGALLRGDLHGEFNRLLALLIDEEAVTLLTQKYVGDAPQTPTRLERLMRLWSEIFPDNRMLLHSGRLLFTRSDAPDSYGAMRLSDGEKAVVYYFACGLFADPDVAMVVDNPGEFLNRALVRPVWDTVERIHTGPMIYVTHDLEFALSTAETGTSILWVKSYDAEACTWDYELLPEGNSIPEDVVQALLGPRKPVLFIEGDGVNSIDAKLYPLVFPEYSVKSLGSCNRVIEATRTFNSLSALHALDATGIVDRDRRAEREVNYLRNHRVLVPEVAEIENILMLEEVIRAVASYNGRDENRVMARVSRTLLKLFAGELEQQALLHTRHRVKSAVEYTVDRRFHDIRALELHLMRLVRDIRPRDIYNDLVREFRGYVGQGDYGAVLRVYNRKSMLTETNVGSLTGAGGGDRRAYVGTVLKILRGRSEQAGRISAAIRRCFGL